MTGLARLGPEAKVAALWAALFLGLLAWCAALSQGHIFYTLDDPYIHLAVAHNLLHGIYGVNVSEYSSPSSSILWPYLLAIPELLGCGLLGPLLLNALAAFATVLLGARLLREMGLLDFRADPLFSAGLTFLLLFATSAFALPMTGMEHSLQVLLALLAYAGLRKAAARQPLPPSLLAALVLMPLVRFEGLALSAASLAALAVLGYRRGAALGALGLAAALGLYAALMHHLGLPLLPSSVLIKSDVVGAGYSGHAHVLVSALANLSLNLTSYVGKTVAGLCLALAAVAVAQRADRRRLCVQLAVLAAVAGHLVLGGFDGFHRYQIYVVALGFLALADGLAQGRASLKPRAWLAARVAFVLLGLAVVKPYLGATLQTPAVARNVYEQQFQMRRFSLERYRGPVATNDLGLASYRNPEYVLDLWGLASEEVRHLRAAHQYGPRELEQLTDEHEVGLAMIYEEWFPRGVPASWRKVAVLETLRKKGGGEKVSFFVTGSGDVDRTVAELRAFQPSLPAGDVLTILEPQ